MLYRTIYIILSIIFILCNFSFGYDHINYYSNSEFSYLESILNVIWQLLGNYSILFSVYFAYLALYNLSFNITVILLLILFTFLNYIIQVLVLIFFLIYIYLLIYKSKAKTIQIKEVKIKKKKDFIKQDYSSLLLKALNEYHIYGKIIDIHYGPLITLYEFEPEPGTKSSRIISLSDDIGISIKSYVRIAVIVGNNTIGIEVANKEHDTIQFDTLADSIEFKESQYTLPVILGQDIIGDIFIADIASMPHLLIAGTTGSGKSVGLNSMIVSLLLKKKPCECKFVLIDPKRLEFIQYESIKHLLYPIVYDIDKVIGVLNSIIDEMNRRYTLLAKAKVKNISQYKKQIPYIIVIIDEFADLVSTLGKELNNIVQRLAQMARAAGIHMILSTQRPSVDIVTGAIKANFPSRIAYQLPSKIDSRIILGEQGAEQLLGNGDMLYLPRNGRIIRLHAPYISNSEIKKIIKGD